MDYKNQCLCGSTEFFYQKFQVLLRYGTQKYRVCKQCGTVKLSSAYYNDKKQIYENEVKHIPGKKKEEL